MAPAESSPRSPVYLSYIYNTPSPASIQANQYRPPPPRAGPGHEASPKQRAGEFRDSPVVTVGDKAKPYHPSTHLTQQQLDLEASEVPHMQPSMQGCSMQGCLRLPMPAMQACALATCRCHAWCMRAKATKTVYHNFHAPWNQHNRFLVAAPPKAKDGYRTLERMPPPPFGNPGGLVSPESAGAMEVQPAVLLGVGHNAACASSWV